MKKFTVVVPVAPDRDAPVLKTIEQMEFDKEHYEVIVNKGTSPSMNRNNGVKDSNGEILAFVDDDALVDKLWLNKAEEFFDKNPSIDIAGGPQLTPESDKLFARQSGYILSSYFGSYKMSSRYKRRKVNFAADEQHLTSANLFVRKKVFNQEINFDPRLFPNEETAFLQKAKKAGYSIAYTPDVVVYHKRRDTLKGYIMQIYGYGKGRARQDILSDTPPNLGIIAAVLFTLYAAAVPLLFLLNPIFIIPLWIYIAISIVNAVYIAVSNKDLFALIASPGLCLITHMAYPVGYIVERVKQYFSKELKRQVQL